MEIQREHFHKCVLIPFFHSGDPKETESKTQKFHKFALISLLPQWNQSKFMGIRTVNSEQIYDTFESCFLSPLDFHYEEVKSEQIHETFEPCFLSPLHFHCEEVQSDQICETFEPCFQSPLDFHCERKWNQDKFITLLSLAFCLIWISTGREMKSYQMYETLSVLSLAFCLLWISLWKKCNQDKFMTLLSLAFCLWISTGKEVQSDQIYENVEPCFLSPLDFHCERSAIWSNVWTFWALLSVLFVPLWQKWNQSKFMKLLSLVFCLLWIIYLQSPPDKMGSQ